MRNAAWRMGSGGRFRRAQAGTRNTLRDPYSHGCLDALFACRVRDRAVQYGMQCGARDSPRYPYYNGDAMQASLLHAGSGTTRWIPFELGYVARGREPDPEFHMWKRASYVSRALTLASMLELVFRTCSGMDGAITRGGRTPVKDLVCNAGFHAVLVGCRQRS